MCCRCDPIPISIARLIEKVLKIGNGVKWWLSKTACGMNALTAWFKDVYRGIDTKNQPWTSIDGLKWNLTFFFSLNPGLEILTSRLVQFKSELIRFKSTKIADTTLEFSNLIKTNVNKWSRWKECPPSFFKGNPFDRKSHQLSNRIYR